jgi:hypothetical protein
MPASTSSFSNLANMIQGEFSKRHAAADIFGRAYARPSGFHMTLLCADIFRAKFVILLESFCNHLGHFRNFLPRQAVVEYRPGGCGRVSLSLCTHGEMKDYIDD